MADAGGVPVEVTNKAGLYLYPVCILNVVALALVAARIYTQLRRTRRLYLDDWIVVAAQFLSLTITAIAIAAVVAGWGKPAHMFTPAALKNTLRPQFAFQTVWIVTLCLVRVSVACSLLRFGVNKMWRFPLYFIIGLQALISSAGIVIQFGQCTPINSLWEASVPGVKCWNPKPIIACAWAFGAIYIAMDLTLSLIPIRLVWTLHRSTTEKALIGFLMSLGLVATAIACVKMTTFSDFGKGDVMQATVKPSMLTRLEEIVGIIACSLACLKRPVETFLKKLGIVRAHEPAVPSFVNVIRLSDDNDQREDSGYRLSGKSSVQFIQEDMTLGSSTQTAA